MECREMAFTSEKGQIINLFVWKYCANKDSMQQGHWIWKDVSCYIYKPRLYRYKLDYYY